MRKVLVVAHLGRHFRIFGQSDYKILIDMGFEVHIAANFNAEIDNFDDKDVIKHQVDFIRNPFHPSNLKAHNQLKKIFDNIHFDIIHCQSPSGGAITRLAAIKTRRRGSKVLYTVHGLHFFEGAPIINWILYFNIEKILGRLTDTIITMNDEDFKSAQNKLKIKNVERINGVGIDLNRFLPQTTEKKNEIREKYKYSNDDFILIYVGELSYRKHQDLLIDAIHIIKPKISNVKLLLVGNGVLVNDYTERVEKLGLQNNIHFLGYRKDIVNLMLLSDVAVSSSRQEGLPLNVMEAMATALPIIVSDCRGNRDLIFDNVNGLVVKGDDPHRFADAIEKLYQSHELRYEFGLKNEELVKVNSVESTMKDMKRIYNLNLSK
jgi:glycosyltransferase EpsD